MTNSLYILQAPQPPWGDYGRILLHGMSVHLDRQDGLIQLERTGPFMPPITFPAANIVLKAGLREQLLQSGLSGFVFAPVIKRHIARLDWHLWDRSAEEPAEYPKGGEPEGYILDLPHSEPTSQMLGDVFELIPQSVALIDRSNGFHAVRGSWGDADIFYGHGARVPFISERARNWFIDTVGEHVAFAPAPVV